MKNLLKKDPGANRETLEKEAAHAARAMIEQLPQVCTAASGILMLEKDTQLRKRVVEIQRSATGLRFDSSDFYSFLDSLADSGHFA